MWTERTPPQGLVRLALIPLLMVACVLAGCSSDSSDNPEGSAGHENTESDSQDEVQRDDLENEHVIEWQRYEQVSDTQIRVFFTTGSPRCYGARAVVEESAETVEIATIEGTLPDAPEVCTLEARFVSMLVETQNVIGDREVIARTEG